MGASKIFLYNRTISKSEKIKKLFSDIEIIDKENIPKDIDMLINASSLGINLTDKIDLIMEKLVQISFIMMLFIIQLKLIF